MPSVFIPDFNLKKEWDIQARALPREAGLRASNGLSH
jgi:hypothetical protein